jgi:chemotaxis protein CheZ
MAEPRKVFRIEQTAAARLESCVDGNEAALRHAEIMRELKALRAALAVAQGSRADAPERGDVARLASDLSLIAAAIRGEAGAERDGAGGAAEDASCDVSSSRVEHELLAVVNGTEKATQQVLAAAEQIEAAANNLSAALEGRIEQGPAQDIGDLVIKIYEACNFQDLIGQRIAKIVATLNFVENRVARMLDDVRNAPAAGRLEGRHRLHGPRLDGDCGHADQGDIDAMFLNRR